MPFLERGGRKARRNTPAQPEEGYGWEKLYQYYQAEGRRETRVARFHNVI